MPPDTARRVDVMMTFNIVICMCHPQRQAASLRQAMRCSRQTCGMWGSCRPHWPRPACDPRWVLTQNFLEPAIMLGRCPPSWIYAASVQKVYSQSCIHVFRTRRGAGAGVQAPTLVMLECVLVYLDAAEAAAVVAALGALLPNAVCLVYEQVAWPMEHHVAFAAPDMHDLAPVTARATQGPSALCLLMRSQYFAADQAGRCVRTADAAQPAGD